MLTIVAIVAPLLVLGQEPLAAGASGIGHDGSYYLDLQAGMEERFPPMGLDTPPLVWSRAVADASILQLVPLLAIMEYEEDSADCRAAGSSTDMNRCLSEVASLGLMSRWPLLSEACPATLRRVARMSCFFAAHGMLADLAFRLGSRSEAYRQRMQGLAVEMNFARLKLEQPERVVHHSSPIRDYDDVAREVAELDAVVLFVDYLHLWSLEEARRLHGQACESLARLGAVEFGCTADLSAIYLNRVKNDIAVQLQVGNFTTECGSELCRWLAAARRGVQPTQLITWSATRVTSDNKDQLSGGPEPAIRNSNVTADAIAPVPRTGPELPQPRKRPIIWVQGGQPIYFPEPALAQPDPEPTKPIAVEPGPGDVIVEFGEVSSELPTGLAYAVDSSSWLHTHTSVPRLTDPSLSEISGWLTFGAEAYDEARDLVPSSRTRFLKRANVAAQGVDLAYALYAGDKVGAYSSYIGFVGGPAGFVAMQLTDFEGKLRRLEGAGIDVDKAISWSLDSAMTFHFGRMLPYSQIGLAPSGRIEPALPSDIMNLERRKSDAEEDKYYKTPCSRAVEFLFGGCG